jgi:hypothetical protein
MGVVVRNFAKQDNTGLWNFPEKAEIIAALADFALDPTSSNQELSFSSSPDTPFRMIFRGQFEALTPNQTLSEFSVVSSNSTVSSLLLYRDGSLWQELTFDAGTKIMDVFPTVMNRDQFRLFASDDIFEGSLQFADHVNGYAGNDTMFGFGATPTGRDVFFGPTGLDVFLGGDGVDTAVFPGARSDYVVSASISIWNPVLNTANLVGYKVTNKAKPDFGNADLHQVERLQFSDFSVALDFQGSAGQAFRVYRAAFDRTPDTIGLGYWIRSIDKGMDMVEVAARFVDSKEFRDLYGTNPTNAQFLTKLYQNVLGRTPEATGYNWWLNELNTNPSKTKAKVLADFSESSENQTSVASLVGNGITYEPWVG